MNGFKKEYSLKKSKKTLLHSYRLYIRQKKKLTPLLDEQIKRLIQDLQASILQGNKASSSELAKKLEEISTVPLKKTVFQQSFDFVLALSFAIFVAFMVRQMWFELYEIPTGSMRPTLKEQDRLVVSKTDFGVNFPLMYTQFYFDPSLVNRNGIFVFTGDRMDIQDVDTMYFYIFPGKKQYIKRLMGRPGDVLYFYGGRMYGIDIDGKDITSDLQLDTLEKIEHIPFLHFEGRVATPGTPINGVYPEAIIYQMNEPVAKLFCNGFRQIEGELLVKNIIQNYSDLWGIKNFGMTRILSKSEIQTLTKQDIGGLEETPFYLEIRHNPSLHALQLTSDHLGRIRPALNVSTSFLPLKESHFRSIFANLYTARFSVKNGFAFRIGTTPNPQYQPRLPDVPDGTYEFYYGKAYEVLWQGITKELPISHPLYRFDLARVQLLYNLGIEFDTRASAPARYTYYFEKDLYLMGAPIFKGTDPMLLSFLDREYTKQSMSKPQNPYVAFEDHGPPFTETGALDILLIKKYGLRIPTKSYLALGDNHAMSADSRVFGFVPQANLRGGPDFIFWPPGSRFGEPNQPPYPFFTSPRFSIWFIFALCMGIWYVVHKRRTRLPLSF